MLGVGIASGSVYSDLMTDLTQADNRLPASTNLDRALDAVQKKLNEAGLEPHIQTFDTLVPRTEWCKLKVDGREISPVYPMNNGIAPLNTCGELKGALVWLGDGSLDALKDRQIQGAIALMDMDAPCLRVNNVFSLGAKAVIFVSAGKATQWNVAAVSFEGPVVIPRLYIDRETAEKSGLLASEGKIASIDAKVSLVDAVGRNLWVEIKGKKDAHFRLGSEEAIILSASLDTIGVVPDSCPGVRDAANAALLADTVCSLVGTKPERSLFALFLGSHNWAQEGARNFYFAIDAANRSEKDEFSLVFRKEKYKAELALAENLLETGKRDDVLDAADDSTRLLAQRIKQKLIGWVNNANADLRNKRIEKMSLQNRLHGAEKDEAALLKKEMAGLDADIAALTQHKSEWNDLRQQITLKHKQSDQESVRVYKAALESVSKDLIQRKRELDGTLANFATHEQVAECFVSKVVVGHFGFDFANDRDPWLLSVCDASDFFSKEDLGKSGFLGGFLQHLDGIGKVYKTIRDPSWKAQLFTDALNPYYKPFSLSVPAQRSTPAAVALSIGQAGYEMMTVGDPLDADELPYRPPCDLSGLVPQMKTLISALATSEELSLKDPFPKPEQTPFYFYYCNSGDDYSGTKCVNLTKGSSDIEGPADNAVVLLRESKKPAKLAGISRCATARVNREGFFSIPMMSKEAKLLLKIEGNAFGYDADGRLNRYNIVDNSDLIKVGGNLERLPMFYGYGGGGFSFGYPPDPTSEELNMSLFLDARSDSPHKNRHHSDMYGLIDYYADRECNIKRIGMFGELLLGSTPKEPKGIGIPLTADSLLNLDGIRQGANDYWCLNESRLKILRDKNIVSDSLETLHAEAKEHLDAATKAREGLNHAEARAHEVFATCLENRVYAPLRGITDDLVKAVIVLLLLNIPFAFAMERLIFGFTTIYKQVMGFIGIFLATFMILFVTHPAFSLASSPIVIFLAFTIIMLGGITIKIVMGKIKQEIKAIQGLSSTVHGMETETNTALAAVIIGISGMRNRPLKTLLTTTTVILLTFTILVFASFTSELGIVETYLGKGQDEDRIEIHRSSYLDIPDDMVSAVKNIYGDDFNVFRRGGLFKNPTKDVDSGVSTLSPERIVYNPANGQIAGFGAIFGLDPGELRANTSIGKILPDLDAQSYSNPPIYFASATVQKLRVKKGDEVKLNGRSFTFAGEFSSAALQSASTIDETKIVPPDFISAVKNIGGEEGRTMSARQQKLEQTDSGTFSWFSPEQVAITRMDTLEKFYPTAVLNPPTSYVTFLALYPKNDGVDIEKAGKALAAVFHGTVHVKSAEGKKRFLFAKAVAGSGFGDIIVPLLLGGLIVFSSLMGSIVDREREIFTYSALGLSPPDVGALFFAESAVYSVVGGMGGYLLSQVVAKILAFLGSHGIVNPPEMNFSSLSSVLTILIVMAVVMLSTIYPAVKAGKSANPGIARKWKMPSPEGDYMRFVFPFTVSKADFAGILSFIKEHFENHGDATLGSFAAKEVKLFRQAGGVGEGESLGISANISLAPFDLGIFQTFRMYSKEFEIKGIEEVVVELKRVSGTPSMWIRSNRMFANELRQQFLLWRSLPIGTIEHYRNNTATVLETLTKI